MDMITLLSNLHGEVSCSVCNKTLTDPKTLPCLHTFCLHCLTKDILQTNGGHDLIACRECRIVFRIVRGDLHELPTNVRNNSLPDLLAIKESNTTRVQCGNCNKKSSHCFYCFHCCVFWCEADCISLHHGIKANKEHRVLALKDFQDQDFENVLKRPAFCQKKHHKNEELLEFFCKICETAICKACALTDHKGHTKILLEEAADERKLQIKSFIEWHKENAQQKRTNIIAKLDESCRQIQEQTATEKQNAQTFAEKMITLIEAKTQEIINKVEKQERESLERLIIQKSEVEHQVKMTEEAVEKTETLLKQSASAELVQLDKSLDAIFQEGDEGDEGERVDSALEGLRQFILVENKTLMNETNTEGIGSLVTVPKTNAHQSRVEGKGISEVIVGLEAQFVLTTRNAEGKQCYDQRDCVTVEIRGREGQDCATKARVQDNEDGSYKISYFAKETGKCDVTVKVNGRQVHGSPFAVQVKPRQFRPVLSFGQQGSDAGMLSKPWGLAVNVRNEIAVSDNGNNRIQVFHSDGTYLRSFGRKGDENGEFNFPSGISMDKNDNIIVADCKNHRVQRFSEQGEHLNTFSSQGNLDHQLKHPHGLSVDSDENIIVADRFNKLIKIFYPNGQFLRSIGDEGSFTFPFHCVQYENYLIVSDSDEHCLKVFHKDGKFLYKFGKNGQGDGEFNVPRCLSVNKAGHLMVCDSWNHRVQVFELSGKFITKFGTKGSGIGKFYLPVSTAVLSDGKIVVTDISKNCIQIFE